MALVLEVKSPKSGRSVLFAKLVDMYAECEYLIRGEDRLHPLICLKDTCHRGLNCMEKLVIRTKCIFDTFESADVLLLYFSYHDFPRKQRAGVFTRNMDEPRYINFNLHAWNKVKSMATIFEWELPTEVLLGGGVDRLHQIGKRGA